MGYSCYRKCRRKNSILKHSPVYPAFFVFAASLICIFLLWANLFSYWFSRLRSARPQQMPLSRTRTSRKVRPKNSCGTERTPASSLKQDWQKLKDSFDKLAVILDMSWWAEQIDPILNEFIQIFDKKFNMKFWRGIYFTIGTFWRANCRCRLKPSQGNKSSEPRV